MDSMTDCEALTNNPWLTVNHAFLTGARHAPTLYMVSISIQPKKRKFITSKKKTRARPLVVLKKKKMKTIKDLGVHKMLANLYLL